MLHKETVSAETLALITRLMEDEALKDFYLVGGTALALFIGHRISIDIDLFTNSAFDAKEKSRHLIAIYQADVDNIATNTISGFISDVKIDLITHNYPLINPIDRDDGIRLLSVEDIAAMKISAIVGNGTRLKDFVDIYFLLETMPLKKMLAAYAGKYPDVTADMAIKSLSYHKDIDLTVPIAFTTGRVIKWQQIQKRLISAIQQTDKMF